MADQNDYQERLKELNQCLTETHERMTEAYKSAPEEMKKLGMAIVSETFPNWGKEIRS
ncbi:MAG: hypothetical protein HUJ54_02840 [Erysipelotrichaceae bacterium]|nr:hypothetical protein [Erysipelotrichaceae bacterium]